MLHEKNNIFIFLVHASKGGRGMEVKYSMLLEWLSHDRRLVCLGSLVIWGHYKSSFEVNLGA